MTSSAVCAGIKVCLVIELNETRDLVNPYPGDRLFLIKVRFQILDSRFVFCNLRMASHAIPASGNGDYFAGGRQLMTIDTIQMSLRSMLFMAERYWLSHGCCCGLALASEGEDRCDQQKSPHQRSPFAMRSPM